MHGQEMTSFYGNCLLLFVILHLLCQFFVLPLVAPAFHIQQPPVYSVDYWLIDHVVGLQEAKRVAAEAAFEDVDTPKFLAFFQNIRNATEVIVPAAMRFGPLHTAPLQEVVGHEVTVFIG